MATDRGMSIAGWLKAGRDPWAYPGPLRDSLVAALPPPTDQPYRLKWDTEIAGFGLRITKAGARSFVVQDRDKGGKQWRLTLGSSPDWSVKQARKAAGDAKQANDSGLSPTAQRRAERAAPTGADLCDDLIGNHLPEKRPMTQRDYRAMIQTIIRPALGKTKVAALRHIDGETLVREIARRGAPYRANRVAALLSLMGNRAVKLEWRTDNPFKQITRAPEEKRRVYLAPDELSKVWQALADHVERDSADAIRLTIATGCRKGEALSASWDQFDLSEGIWTKPGALTKQKSEHSVPLNELALALLHEVKQRTDARNADRRAEGRLPVKHLFADLRTGQPLRDVRKTWDACSRTAGIRRVRLHDLRHSYASVLVSSGVSLPTIGALLGHTQAATTHRYAHLFRNALRAATEKVGQQIDRKQWEEPKSLPDRV